MPTWSDRLFSRLGVLGFDRRLPVVATVLMTLMLAQTMAMLTWDLLPQAEVDESAVVVKAGGETDQNKKNTNNLRQISQWHLFGQAQKTAPVAKDKVTEAPDTRLNLKLKGVLASSNPVTARAIIADGKGIEDSYAVGKKLPGNAILREIYADRVILEYRGRLETLRLPKEASVDLSPKKNNKKNGDKEDGRKARAASANTIRNTETSALLRQYREALISDPQSIMNLVSAAPVTDKDTGKLKGYRIRPGKEKKLLRKFGLRNGDVVTAVNGVALDNPIKALEIMRDLSTASSVSIDVERRGSVQSFSFQVD